MQSKPLTGSDIRRAALAAGLADPSLSRIARLADCSEASVARILRDGPSAAPKVAARVLRALGLEG